MGPAGEMLLMYVALFLAAIAIIVFVAIRPLWPRIVRYWNECRMRDLAVEAKREKPSAATLREAEEMVRPLCLNPGDEADDLMEENRNEGKPNSYLGYFAQCHLLDLARGDAFKNKMG